MSIFKIPEGDNLVTYYVLPLIRLNRESFGKSYITSFVDKAGKSVYIKLKSAMASPLYRGNPNFKSEVIINNILYVIFTVPAAFNYDVALFTEGRYSEMSKSAKKVIYKISTLPYNSTMGSFKVSHPVLQALDKTKTLRTFLSNTIGIDIDNTTELMESPDDSWFIESEIKS